MGNMSPAALVIRAEVVLGEFRVLKGEQQARKAKAPQNSLLLGHFLQ